jgi:hypothetical protein
MTRISRKLLRTASLALLAYVLAQATARSEEATVYVMPVIPTEAQKILALKLAYEANGNSMVGFGRMIDLTGPMPPLPPPLTDELMPVPKKQEKKK